MKRHSTDADDGTPNGNHRSSATHSAKEPPLQPLARVFRYDRNIERVFADLDDFHPIENLFREDTVIGNTEVLIARIFRSTRGTVMQVFSRFRNHWLPPVLLPIPPLRYADMKMAGFCDDSRQFAVLYSVEQHIKLYVYKASERYDAFSIVSLTEIPLPDGYWLVGGHRVAGSKWLVILQDFRRSTVQLYETTGTSGALIGTIPLNYVIEHHALYEHRLYFIVADYEPGTFRKTPKLCVYDMARGGGGAVVQRFAEFERTPFTDDGDVYMLRFFEGRVYAFTNVDYERDPNVYMYDVHSDRWTNAPFHAKIRNLRILASGEALLHTNTDAILSFPLKPPRLLEIALRALHQLLPERTASRLRESDVISVLSLTEFLLN